MRLQCLSVVSQGYGTVWSDNVPGIQAYDYRRLGRSDYEAYDRDSCDRPLPGAITHQMDVAAVKYLRKLEKLFVKELAALIFKPRIKPWYELFLAFYVIFWNLEYINQGAKGYMKSKNGTVRHSSDTTFAITDNCSTSFLPVKSTASSTTRSRSGSLPFLCFFTTGGAHYAATHLSKWHATIPRSCARMGI